jgi:hypothetical protein
MNRLALFLAFGFLLPACNKNEFGPVSAPAADHPSYAASYPQKLESTTKRFQIEKSWAQDFATEFKKFPEELKDPDWEVVARVYMLAEEDGKSSHYADVRQTNAEVAQFFVEEKEELVRKISGGVQYQADQAKCDAKFYSAVDRGLENGVKERFEKREEDGSRAQQHITYHETEIGKENSEKLRAQARSLSAGAQLVYVDLARRHQELTKMVDEGDGVKKTIDKRLKELSQEKDAEMSPQEKQARAEEMKRLETAQTSHEASVSSARTLLETSEEEVKNARESFETALSELRAEIKKRRTAAGAGSKSE